MKLRKVIADNVKEKRKAMNYKSSRAFAEDIHVPPVTIARLEAGLSYPEETTIEAVAKGLGIEEHELLQPPSDRFRIMMEIIGLLPTMNELELTAVFKMLRAVDVKRR